MGPNNIQDMSLKYGGRVLVVTAVVNTETDPYDIQKRVNRALRGDRLDAVVVKIEGYSGEAGVVAWKAAQAVSTKIAAHPKAQSTDEPFRPTGAMDELRAIVKEMPAGALDEATVKDAIMALERTNTELTARAWRSSRACGSCARRVRRASRCLRHARCSGTARSTSRSSSRETKPQRSARQRHERRITTEATTVLGWAPDVVDVAGPTVANAAFLLVPANPAQGVEPHRRSQVQRRTSNATVIRGSSPL